MNERSRFCSNCLRNETNREKAPLYAHSVIQLIGSGTLEVRGIPIGAIIQPVILWMFIFLKEYKKESRIT